MIHERAMVHPSVKVDPSNEIGPNVIIEAGVRLGRQNRILANAYLCSGTTIGDENEIHMGTVIGHVPQDTSFKGEPTFTRIGDRNIIREFATIHRGTEPGTSTEIGHDCFLMSHSHVAHNCRLKNKVSLVSNSVLAGHVQVDDGAFISGLVVAHQFTRIGRLAMISGLSGINRDLPPFMIAHGRPAAVHGVNVVGLRRAGFTPEARRQIQEAYRLLYRSDQLVSEALEALADDPTPEVSEIVRFIQESRRGVMHPPDAGAKFEL